MYRMCSLSHDVRHQLFQEGLSLFLGEASHESSLVVILRVVIMTFPPVLRSYCEAVGIPSAFLRTFYSLEK